MKPLSHCTLALFLSVMLWPAIAAAQRNLTAAPAQKGEGRIALVIGNSAYKQAPLANPTNDAADIAKALQDVGFKVILKRNANTRDMRQAIREFGSELRRAEVGLFYFAGHGLQVKGNNYLVPVGADIENEADAEDLAIDANYALRTMEEAQVKVSIVILDACRNNPLARGFRSASRGLATMNAATGSLIAFATAPGSVAADGVGRNGIYTKHLLASLAQLDTDILKVFQRTRAAVVKETGGKQTPWESTSLIGDFYFRPQTGGAQVAAIVPSPEAAIASSTPDPSAESNYQRGVQYLHGYGVPQDDDEALRWIKKAVDQGHAVAQVTLGFMYQNGRSVRIDEVEGARWIRKAAGQGNADGQLRLGPGYGIGRGGMPKDEVEAARWIRKAADQGVADAQVHLAQIYLNGKGVPKDEAEAARWYRKVVDQGNEPKVTSLGGDALVFSKMAHLNLGEMYENGKGVPKDEVEAARLYRIVADRGWADGQYQLGALYESGRGVQKNVAEAVRWYQLAARQGNKRGAPQAQASLKRLGASW